MTDDPLTDLAAAARTAGQPVIGGVVASDIPCRRCQYNLRGLSPDGRCPECGTPVGFSIQGDLLRFCDPDWVTTLRRGVSLMLWSIAVLILASVAGSVLRMAGGLGPLAPLGLTLVGGLMGLVGQWRLTTPDPSGLGEDRYGTSRKLIRVTTVIGLGEQAVSFVEQAAVWPPVVQLAFSVAAGLSAVVGVVAQFATLVYLGKLARRIPDRSLADRARLLTYGIGIPMAVLAVTVVGMRLAVALPFASSRPGDTVLALGCVAGLAGLALIVFGVMYLFMLGRFATAFRVQAEVARATWAQPPAPADGPPLAGGGPPP